MESDFKIYLQINWYQSMLVLDTCDLIFAPTSHLNSTHNFILFFQVNYIICRSIINVIFFGVACSLLVTFSNLAAQSLHAAELDIPGYFLSSNFDQVARCLHPPHQKEFFFSSANVLVGQPGVSTLQVAATTLGCQVFPPSQSQHPHSTTQSLGLKLEHTWPLSSVQQFHASMRRREEESRDVFHFNQEELGYRKAHTFLCQ